MRKGTGLTDHDAEVFDGQLVPPLGDGLLHVLHHTLQIIQGQGQLSSHIHVVLADGVPVRGLLRHFVECAQCYKRSYDSWRQLPYKCY